MANSIININESGKDVLKGGIFFGSNLTPSGSFSNIPQVLTPNQIIQREATLILTLEQIKNSIGSELQKKTGASASNDTIEQFLVEFVDLMIDYRDLRNYVFYGSANTELAYNIKALINDYPYNTLIAQKTHNNFIKLRNYISKGKEKTEIIFPETYYFSPNNFERVILDNFNKFNFFDDNAEINWNNYEILDKNGKRYPIQKVITPYKSPTIFKVIDIQTIPLISPLGTNYKSIQIITDSNHNYVPGQTVTMVELVSLENNAELRFSVDTFNGSTYDSYYYEINREPFKVDFVTSNTLTLSRLNGAAYETLNIDYAGLSSIYDTTQPGIVRLYDAKMNMRPYVIKINIEGYLNYSSFLDFELNNDSYKGFMIVPIISIVNDWNAKLTPIQNMLLAPAPVNPTPWPRRPVTGNIMNILDTDAIEQEFYDWIKDPKTLYLNRVDDEGDVDSAYSYSLGYEYNMVRGTALDESYSNQIIRRMVPADLINEIYDTDDFYFQRFLLVAGWLFDKTRLYAKFIKYAHTVNHEQYNQLSPQNYRYFASYYGFNLFEDDSIDFSKLVIQTVPGTYFGVDPLKSQYYQQTIQELQYSRQKNLLQSIISLYTRKGTQDSIKQMVSLLGAPDGFFLLEEYAFQVSNLDSHGYPLSNYNGTKIIDNEKIHTPNINFEIDPDYLVDKINLNNPLNKPYVYKAIYDNEYTHNLREIAVHTDPNGAIDNQIINLFGEQKYNYITFKKGEFANLQSKNDFFLLPLTLPDRFYGFSIEYMIPRNGFSRGIGSGQEEATCNIMSLYKIAPVNVNPFMGILQISFDSTYSVATIELDRNHNFIVGDNVYISEIIGIVNINDLVFNVESIISNTSFEIFGDFSGSYGGSGTVRNGKIDKFTGDSNGVSFTYPLAVEYNERNRIIDSSFALDSYNNSIIDGYTNPPTDFDKLKRLYPNSTFIDDSYIIARLEGNDLVFRLRINSEISGTYGERCAVLPKFFVPDGLNHSLRFIMREIGVEIYQDYMFIGIAKWINFTSAGPYSAYEIPKSELLTLINSSDDCINYYESIALNEFIAQPTIYNTGIDAVNWWDLFIGMPNNIDFYFKKIGFFEEQVINDYNIADKLVNDKSYTAEFYVFEVANPIKDSTIYNSDNNFNIDAVFYEMFPNSMPVYYGYVLPIIKDQYNREIINGMGLSNKSVYQIDGESVIYNLKQDFFNAIDLFAQNAWSEDIHKIYEYPLFSGLLQKLYELYAAQVLTYASLQDFIDLIEKRLKSTFEQFIPIVVNISEFGRIVKNSIFNQAKMRIPGNNKVCVMKKMGTRSYVTTKVYKSNPWTDDGVDDTIDEGVDFTIYDIYGSIIFQAQLDMTLNRQNSLVKIVDTINSSMSSSGDNFTADYYHGILRVSTDYDWFVSVFGFDPNLCILQLRQNLKTYIFNFHDGSSKYTGYHGDIFDNCGKIISPAFEDSDVCGYISYSLPGYKSKPTYIYYKTENKPKTFIQYSYELGTHPLWVQYSNE